MESNQTAHDAPPSPAEFDFDVFISYTTATDYALVRDLEPFLERFHRLKTPDGHVLSRLQACVDGSDFSVTALRRAARRTAATSATDEADELWRLIVAQLSRCRRLLVVCPGKEHEGPWVGRELEWFLANRGRDDVLLAISAGAEPWRAPTAFFAERIIKEGLHEKLWYDLRGFRRRAARGWTKVRDFDDERTRLAADLSGVPAGVVQPAWRRRERRRMRAWVAGASAVAVTLLVLSVFLYVARGAARRAEAQARQAQGEAERRQAHALVAAGTALSARMRPEGGALLAEARSVLLGLGERTLPADMALWDHRRRCRELLLTLQGVTPPGAPLERLAFSPDVRKLAVAARVGPAPARPGSPWGNHRYEVALWDVRTWTRERTVGELTGQFGLTGLAFARGGGTLLAAADGVVSWDLATGAMTPVGGGSRIAVSSDGRWVASDGRWADADKRWMQGGEATHMGGHYVSIRDLESGVARSAQADFNYAVTSVAVAPDGGWVAWACLRKAHGLWKTREGGPHGTLTFHATPGRIIEALTAAPDGRLAWSTSSREIWISTPGEAGGPQKPLANAPTSATGLQFARGGALLVGTAFGRRVDAGDTVKVWSTDDGSEALAFDALPPTLSAFGEGAGHFVGGDADGRIHVWADRDVAVASPQGAAGWSRRPGRNPLAPGPTAGASTDGAGRILAVPGAGGGVDLIDVHTGLLLRNLRAGVDGRGAVHGAALSSDARLLVLAYLTPTSPWAAALSLEVWDVGRGTVLRRTPLGGWDLLAIVSRPDGRLHVTLTRASSAPGTTRPAGPDMERRDAETWEPIGSADEPRARLSVRQISGPKPEGGYPVVLTRGGGGAGHVVGKSESWATTTAEDPPGRHVALGDDAGGIALWSIDGPASARRLDRPWRHEAAISALAFDPSGDFLYSAGEDGTVRLWDCRVAGGALQTIRTRERYTSDQARRPDPSGLRGGLQVGLVRGLASPATGVLVVDAEWAAQCWDFRRAAAISDLRPRAESAQATLAANPWDPAALAVAGRWLSLNGADAAAVERFGRVPGSARTADDRLALARSLWRTGAADPDAARRSAREFDAAVTGASDDSMRRYLRLCRDAAERLAASAPPPTTRPSTRPTAARAGAAPSPW